MIFSFLAPYEWKSFNLLFRLMFYCPSQGQEYSELAPTLLESSWRTWACAGRNVWSRKQNALRSRPTMSCSVDSLQCPLGVASMHPGEREIKFEFSDSEIPKPDESVFALTTSWKFVVKKKSKESLKELWRRKTWRNGNIFLMCFDGQSNVYILLFFDDFTDDYVSFNKTITIIENWNNKSKQSTGRVWNCSQSS